ncbi:MAG TPA: GNAT family N-acetyltransferase [Ktedonobacteraceae bacterium]|jgi:predicted N-acetyltransferase YhbS
MPDLVVRPLQSPEEYLAYYRLASAEFAPEPSEEEEMAQRWLRSTRDNPDFRAENVRGAFRAEEQAGGYMLHDRVLRMGAACISTGCIAAVVTALPQRRQGVATALMRDALACGRGRGNALLLLDGIPDFYFRFGYIDMFDVAVVEIDLPALLARPAGACQVRPAVSADAPALLALYQRHYGAYTGSFERSQQAQLYALQARRQPVLTALSPQGEIEGYLLHGQGDRLTQGREIAADNLDALLALLHAHARLCAGETTPASLLYFLPHEAPMTHWLIDVLQVPDTSQWGSPALEWGIRTLSYHHRFAGWMCCLVDFPLLLAALLPELQARWQRALAHWSGAIDLSIAGKTGTLYLEGAQVRLAANALPAPWRLELSPQALVQLIFGYRPLSSLADLSLLPAEARAALAILFPPGHTWIPYSDWF